MIFFIKQLHLIQPFSSNIETIEKGIGFEFILLTSTLLCITGSIIASFFVNWQLTLIMLCIIPFVIGSSFVFDKVCIVVQSIRLASIVIDDR
jgi:ABC-type multidrug transport system fused ATPase/permease subunit